MALMIDLTEETMEKTRASRSSRHVPGGYIRPPLLVRLSSEIRRNWMLMLMILPAVLYVLVFAYAPMPGIILAFKDFNYNKGIFGSPWSGLDNFKFFFVSGQFVSVIRNTVLYNMAFIVVGMVLEVGLAIVLSEMKSKTQKKILQTSIFMPYFVSWVVAASIMLNIFGYEYGILNSILKVFGEEPINIYSSPKIWPPLLIALKAWKATGYGTVVYLAAITGLDQQMFEAADIDGASVWQKIRFITIPCLVPMIMLLFLLALGSIFKGDFGLFYQVARDPQIRGITEIIDTYIYRMLVTAPNVGMSAAGGLFQSVICFIFIMTANGIVHKAAPDYALF